LSERFGSILRGIVDDTTADHSLKSIAMRTGFSVRHLNRLFVEHTGATPARYVEAVRVAAAADLLRTTSEPLTTVAGRAGFGSVETMRRAFLRAVHVTPGAYRRRSEPPEHKR
jgi:transcriptional regulator GlxA family with amidase domain